jgi:predicted ribonuclease YlaK
MDWRPLAERLLAQLAGIEARLIELLASVPIVRFHQEGGVFFIAAPDYYWGTPSPDQRAEQIAIKRGYDRLSELLRVILAAGTEDLHRDLAAADGAFRKWLELQRNYSLTADVQRNAAKFKEDANALHSIIDIIAASAPQRLVVVPDTGTLMEHPDPVQYRGLVGVDDFVFALLPTVLAELDDLKVDHSRQPARELAIGAIRRVKGWRNQGSLREGVKVNGTIVVQALHDEPHMDRTLSWLDPTVKDDRIVASILQLQAEYPAAPIVLITNDVNLLNKADAAGIQATDFPEA